MSKLHISDPLLDIAKHLEVAALRDSYFVERKLFAHAAGVRAEPFFQHFFARGVRQIDIGLAPDVA